ncbi:MAG TPA: hypothetical protein V6D05_15495 [Stenomitos sp.]
MKDKISRIPLKRVAAIAALGLALAGCSLVPQLFPVANQHPASWRADHGRAVLGLTPSTAKVANGMTCDQCHTATMSVDVTVPAPSKGSNLTCFSCHSDGPSGSPHPNDWKLSHGPFTVRSGGVASASITNEALDIKDQSCNTCHTVGKNADGTVSPSPKAKTTCFTCHDSGASGNPHPAGWQTDHLKDVHTNGDQSCAACHTTTKDASGVVPASPKASNTCFTCHELRADKAPHPDAAVWGMGGLHARIVTKYGYGRPFVDENGMPHEACVTCHTVAKDESGAVPASPLATRTCFDCHDGPNGR